VTEAVRRQPAAIPLSTRVESIKKGFGGSGPLPGSHAIAVAARRGAQVHLGITPRLTGLGNQAEQLAADIPGGIGRVRRPGVVVEARHLVRHARARRPALQLRGQGQGGLAERTPYSTDGGPSAGAESAPAESTTAETPRPVRPVPSSPPVPPA
jgi:hypothetical protein